MSFQATAYTPGNLSALLSEAQDNQLLGLMGGSYEKSGLTYDEMLNYAPTSMTTQYPNPAGLSGFGAAQSMNPLWWVLAAGALGYFFFVRPRYAF